MARRKRWNPASVLGELPSGSGQSISIGTYSTAAYVRLSLEDGGKADSFSLQNQKSLLTDYIAQHPGLCLYKLYEDNGFTGTQFQRPAFDEMMEDMKAGRIQCIVVKDLSRLGRNYLETGHYLEQVFPFYRVRFIAVTDGYDSDQANVMDEALTVPLKNLVNEGYARDISLKVSTAIAARKKQGKFMGKYPPYGYRKDPKDKNHLIIDPQTAPVVQRIFALRAQGMDPGDMADILNREGIPCPACYRLQAGISNETRHADSRWNRSGIRRILKDQVYLGMIVFGKEVSSFAKGIPRHAVPQSQWQTAVGTHEPLVARELFERVNTASKMAVQQKEGKQNDR